VNCFCVLKVRHHVDLHQGHQAHLQVLQQVRRQISRHVKILSRHEFFIILIGPPRGPPPRAPPPGPPNAAPGGGQLINGLRCYDSLVNRCFPVLFAGPPRGPPPGPPGAPGAPPPAGAPPRGPPPRGPPSGPPGAPGAPTPAGAPPRGPPPRGPPSGPPGAPSPGPRGRKSPLFLSAHVDNVLMELRI
jgi:hypothetical protein